MTIFNFPAKWGESYDITFSVTDDDGDPFNLTGYEVKWRVNGTKKTEGDGVDVIDPEGGEVVVSLTTDDTEVEPGKYWHELRVFGDTTQSPIEGTMTIKDSRFRDS